MTAITGRDLAVLARIQKAGDRTAIQVNGDENVLLGLLQSRLIAHADGWSTYRLTSDGRKALMMDRMRPVIEAQP